MKVVNAFLRHKWRYIALISGFILFVAPPALLIRGANLAAGSSANSDLHKICFRMPFDWLAAGKLATFAGRPLQVIFLGVVFVTAFIFGPLFCGWLCPVGSTSEGVSHLTPKKVKIDLSQRLNPAAIRYGFLASFIFVSAVAAFIPALGIANICCRFCASSQLQNLVAGIFNPSTLQYWHSGAIMVIGTWLILGGLFWKGGRGWCLYACPLGAVSNLIHFAGSKLPFTWRVKHDPSKCTECDSCEDVCPSWAISRHSKEVTINLHTCIACLECVKACDKGCYTYGRGK